MDQREQRDDAVDGGGREFERGHVRSEKRGVRHGLAGVRDLVLGEVHAEDVEPLRQAPRDEPGPAAEVEHGRPFGQHALEVVEPAIADLRVHLERPLAIARAETVVPVADNVPSCIDVPHLRSWRESIEIPWEERHLADGCSQCVGRR